MRLFGADGSTAGSVFNPAPKATVTLSPSFFSARLSSAGKLRLLKPRPAHTKRLKAIHRSTQTFIIVLPSRRLLVSPTSVTGINVSGQYDIVIALWRVKCTRLAYDKPEGVVGIANFPAAQARNRSGEIYNGRERLIAAVARLGERNLLPRSAGGSERPIVDLVALRHFAISLPAPCFFKVTT